jgi:hypothetical protein
VLVSCAFDPRRFELRLRTKWGERSSYERDVDFEADAPRFEWVERLPNGTFEVELIYDEWVVGHGTGEVNGRRATLSLEPAWR